MKRKILIASLIGIVILAGVLFILMPSGSGSDVGEKQLYTCGMHPQIISDEPGNCPICEMKLVPIKSNNVSVGGRKILYWRAPMDPNEIYEKPGKSKMGMDLVPVYEDEAGAEGIVRIDPVVEQNMNLKTEAVMKKNLSQNVITNGVLKTDETREYIVTTRVDGWVQKLYVNYTGQKVRNGDKLMDIYSPELLSAEQEYLTALSYRSSINNSSLKDIQKSGNELVDNAYKKLQLLEMSDSEIEKLKNTKELKTYVTLYAQKSGTVVEKKIIEGEKIKAGEPLLHITDLSNLWLTADIYEYELSKINLGASAKIKYNFMQGKTFSGKVSFIYPTIESKSRTARIRIDVANTNGELKPEMFANVEIHGRDLGETLVVPESSVLRSGTKDMVILSLGGGKFKPQGIHLGGYSDGYYQVLKGLNEGDKVVTSAQFLIDSESNLKAAVSQFSGAQNNVVSSSSKEEETPAQTGKMKDENMEHDQSAHSTEADKIQNMDMQEESIVRQGVIDLNMVDMNKDGKVFQDLMDWNVLSDAPGRCPVCGMKLKEVTLETAKNNLIEHGFQVK
ncbi:MAG: efflux transporter periplasmic adaptor subunit [Ignavibacteria bacterium RBG_13_36_8]|nr:MAG: efflux transporter periplasmic adaptor subunit [Ignavibacteria bacterium RBG_13_36_8]